MAATVKLKKPIGINDSGSNGGMMTSIDVKNDSKENIFPNVDESSRTTGMTRLRKVFLKKETGSLDSAKFFIDRPSTAGDYFRIIEGTDTDVQSQATGYTDWSGAGEVIEALGTSNKTIIVEYDNNDGVSAGDKISIIDWDDLTGEIPALEYLDVETAVFTIGEGDVEDENCSDISDWTDNDSDGASTQETFDGRETFKFTVATAGSGRKAERQKDIGTIADSFTVELRTYFDSLGTLANGDYFYFAIDNGSIILRAVFASDGLYIYDGATYNEVGTDVVDTDTWTIWRFVIDGSVSGSETVDVEKDGTSIGDDIDCSDGSGATDGDVILRQSGVTTNGVTSYTDFLKVSDDDPDNSNECFIYCNTGCVSSHSVKTRGKVEGTADENFDVDGETLVIKIDGGTSQTVTFTGNGKTAAQAVSDINATLSGGTAYVLSSTKVAIRTDSYYKTGSIQVLSSSTADTTLGLDNSIHYGTDGTVVSSVLELGSILSSHTTPAVNSTSGTWDDSNYPVKTFDDGTTTEDWTATFTDSENFDVSGSISGNVGSGNVNSDFQPAHWGSYYFKLPSAGWGGTWANGDTLTFSTVNSAKAVWIKEVVPASTPAYSGNRVSFTLDGETT